MSRVKFNVNSEYAYIQNFKILQSESYLALPQDRSICPIHTIHRETLPKLIALGRRLHPVQN
jgi:hypothetical protein